MKRRLLTFILALLLLTSGCVLPMRTTRVIGSGNTISEVRNVSDFDSIRLSGIGTLVITQGNRESLEITAEDNIIEYLQSKVVGKNLRLDIRDFINLDPTEDITYKVTVVDLEKIDISGLGDLEIESLQTSRLHIDISGSGDADLNDLMVNDLFIDISGLGNVKVSGETETQRVNLSGAGFYNAENLTTSEAKVSISGTGKAVVWVQDNLDIELSGLGDFKYYGSPNLKTDISGLGTVESLGEK
jgi:hypothetical protein